MLKGIWNNSGVQTAFKALLLALMGAVTEALVGWVEAISRVP